MPQIAREFPEKSVRIVKTGSSDVEGFAKKETTTLRTLQLFLFEMTQNGRFKWFQAGAAEAKDG